MCQQGTKLANSAGSTLYDFWRDEVTSSLQELIGHDGLVVNCASQEYAKVVGDVPMLTMTFPGPAIYAKQARGAMVRFAMQHRITDVEALKGFTGVHAPGILAYITGCTGNDGEWAFDADASDDRAYVFRRSHQAKKQKQEAKPPVTKRKRR